MCLSWLLGKFFFPRSWLRHSRGKNPSLFFHTKGLGQSCQFKKWEKNSFLSREATKKVIENPLWITKGTFQFLCKSQMNGLAGVVKKKIPHSRLREMTLTNAFLNRGIMLMNPFPDRGMTLRNPFPYRGMTLMNPFPDWGMTKHEFIWKDFFHEFFWLSSSLMMMKFFLNMSIQI